MHDVRLVSCTVRIDDTTYQAVPLSGRGCKWRLTVQDGPTRANVGNQYQVAITADGELRCSCGDAVYRRAGGRKGPCKHLDLLAWLTAWLPGGVTAEV